MKKKYKFDFLLKGNISLAILGVLISIIYCILLTAIPLVSEYLIDNVLSANLISQVYVGISVFLGVCICQPIFYFIKERIFVLLSERILYKLRLNAFSKLSRLPMAYFETHKYGEISTKIVSDTKEISNFSYAVLCNLVTSVISILFLTIAMFLESWFISLIIVLLLILFVTYNTVIAKRFKKYAAQGIALSEDIQGIVKQNFDSALLTKLYSVNRNNKKAENVFLEVKKNNTQIKNTANDLNAVSMAITSIALCIIYGIGAIMIIEGNISLGTVIAMGLFFQSLNSPLSTIVGCNISYNRVSPSFKRISELLDETEEKGGKIGNPDDRLIKFSNVKFTYPKMNNLIFNDTNFVINGNGCYAITGASGSGKSTLAKMILGLYVPIEGSVRIFGEDITEINKGFLRNNISYISQDVELYNDSILNNLKLANNDATFEEIKELCIKFKIHDKIMSLENDYYETVTEKINLSGGEKRRIAIVRGLLKSVPIYIFDEAESYLEEEYKPVLLEIFQKLAEKSIVLVITHDSQIINNIKNRIEL